MRRVQERKERHCVLTGRHGVFDVDRMERVEVDEVKVDHKICHWTRRGHRIVMKKVSVTRNGFWQNSEFTRGPESSTDRYE